MASRARIGTTTYDTNPIVLARDRLAAPTSEPQSVREIGIDQTPEPEPLALKGRIRPASMGILSRTDGQGGSETGDL